LENLVFGEEEENIINTVPLMKGQKNEENQKDRKLRGKGRRNVNGHIDLKTRKKKARTKKGRQLSGRLDWVGGSCRGRKKTEFSAEEEKGLNEPGF